MGLTFAQKDTNFTGKILTVSMLKSILSAGMFEKLPGTFCYHDFVVLGTASVVFHYLVEALHPVRIWSYLDCDHPLLSPGFRLCRCRFCFLLF